ncbi:MAG: hypothetical protein M3R59_06210 [Verrucomicrobiota bacterium]|nr:hypothetical protein [Verrucomicrobiota bacterium]
MNAFLKALQQPEYVHTLLNPIPIYGLVVGVIALIAALFWRNVSVQKAALVIVFLASLSVWPVMLFGGKAKERIIPMTADADGEAWLSAHEQRADNVVWVYYTTAALSLAALVLPRFYPKARMPLVMLTALLGCGALVAGSYIAYAGGRIRHREFRLEPPPSQSPDREG